MYYYRTFTKFNAIHNIYIFSFSFSTNIILQINLFVDLNALKCIKKIPLKKRFNAPIEKRLKIP